MHKQIKMNIGKTHLTQQQFDKLWISIRHELTLLYNNYKCSASLVYNNIYIICTSTTHKYVEDLYWKIGDFLYEILRNNKYLIFEAKDWIKEYIKLYEKYLYFVRSINDLADYLNQYITSKSIYHFAFLLWERCILQSCYKYKEVNLGEYLVSHSNHDEVKICIQSLKNILVDPENPLLYYTERYEKFALSAIIDKCTIFVDNFKKDDIIEYTKAVNKFLIIERKRRKKIFLKESWDKLDSIIEDILVIQKKKWIKNEIYKILMQHGFPVEILNTVRNSMFEYQKCNVSKKIDISNIYDSQSHLNKIEVINKGDVLQFKSNNINDIKNSNNLNENTLQYKNNRNILTIDKMPYFPLNDFYALFMIKIPSLYTYSTPALNQIKIITENLAVVKYASDLLDRVLLKFLNSQLLTYNHLLDKKIETLYIFYTLFNHVVKVGFHNSKNANLTLEYKLKEIYNSLNPSLTCKLIKFTNTIVNGECVLEQKNIALRKSFIDFYDRNEICNMNEEEGIDYWGDNDSTTSSEKEKEPNNSEIIPFTDSKLIDSKEEPPLNEKIYKPKYNNSLPNLSKFKKFSYRDGALLRVFVHLYNLIDDKVDFFKKYLQELSRRVLLYDINYPKELELFRFLVCDDRDLKLKGEIMFSDMKTLISTESGVHLLTDSAWNLEIEDIPLKLPDFFLNKMKLVHKSRLRWAWEYSIVIFETNKKNFRVNIFQYLIINLYNSNEFVTKALIKDKTGLSKSLLESTLKSLIKSKFINQVGTRYFLNPDAEIMNIVDYFIKEDTDETHEIDQEMYYLSKVASTMKKFKKMSRDEIQNNILNLHSNKFSFSSELFEKGIQSGIEKGIIKEKKGFYIYMP